MQATASPVATAKRLDRLGRCIGIPLTVGCRRLKMSAKSVHHDELNTALPQQYRHEGGPFRAARGTV